MKIKIVILTILSFSFVFLTAFSIFDEQNVLMTENKLINFGKNEGTGIFDEGDNSTPVSPSTTPSTKPSVSPTPAPKKVDNNYRIRIRSKRIYWGVGSDEDNNTDMLLDDFDELKNLISTKLISGSSLYVIDDYGESETYKSVRDLVSSSKRQYTLHFVPDYSVIEDISEDNVDNAQ